MDQTPFVTEEGVDAVVEPYSTVLCSRHSVENPDGCMALDSEASDFNAQRVGLLTGCDVSTMRERLWEAWWTSISSDVIILFRLGLWQSRVHVVGRSVVWHSPPGCQSLVLARARRRYCTLADGTLPDGNIFTVGAKCICPAGNHREEVQNGACSVASRARLFVVCSDLLVLTERAFTYQSSLVTWFHVSPSLLAERGCGTKL